MMENSKDAPNTEQPSTSDETAAPAPEPEETATSNVVVTPPANSDESQDDPASPRVNSGLLARRQANNPSSSELNSVNGIDMPNRPIDNDMNGQLEHENTRTETPDPDQITAEQVIAGEGPLTPRTNAGPFVFDGSAGQAAGGRRVAAIPEDTEEGVVLAE